MKQLDETAFGNHFDSATLHPDWIVVPLTALAELNPPWPDKIPAESTEVSFVPMAAVEELTGRLAGSSTRPWQSVRTGYKRFQEGDVLFAKITPSMENGKVALALNLVAGIGAGSTEFHVLRTNESLLPRFLCHYLLQEDLRKQAKSQMTGTAGQLRVPESFLARRLLELPPKPEQHRIVEALDSYLTRLDAAIEGLKRVEANLKRYQTSVLKAAVEGRLVPTEAEMAR